MVFINFVSRNFYDCSINKCNLWKDLDIKKFHSLDFKIKNNFFFNSLNFQKVEKKDFSYKTKIKIE